MVTFIKKFTNISTIEYKKCSNLLVGVKYPIEQLKNDTSKFGLALSAVVIDGHNTKRCKLYLPKRHANKFTDEELNDIQQSFLQLVYHGLKECCVIDVEIM